MSAIVAELPDLYEVVNGQIVEPPPMSAKSSAIASELVTAINPFAKRNKLGKAFAEILIAMPDRFEHNRRPDMIYVSAAKWPIDRMLPDDNAWEIVPDLCVEVVSPNDSANELRTKIDEYFEAGVPLVWVVYPNDELVDIYDSPNANRTLRRSDTLTGGSVIPGFALPLAELFLPA